MTLHLIKLCVGVTSVEELIDWQQRVLKQKKRRNQPQLLDHVTWQMPKRRDEILNGGSLYWVIGGHIACRQQILDLRPCVKNSMPHCRIVLSPETIRVLPRLHRPFQGWRYLEAKSIVRDLTTKGCRELPPTLLIELNRIGIS